MIPIKFGRLYGRLQERECYRVAKDGSLSRESLVVSHQVFGKPELGHIVLPYEFKPVLDRWSSDILRAEDEGAEKFFELRIVRWGKLWFVVTMNFHSLYSFAIIADDKGYELTQQEYVQDFKGRRELFPFTSPTFWRLRLPLLLLGK